MTILARCARVEPAIAFMPSAAVSACTSNCLSCCTTFTPLFSASVSEPFAPFSVTASAPIVAVTPCGRSTGIFATRDIVKPYLTLLDDEQHFAAGAGRARLLVGHDALRGGDHRNAQTAQHLGKFILAAIDAQARPADALDAIDDGPAVVILQFNGQGALGAAVVDTEVRDVALGLQHLENGHLQLRGAHAHGRLARGLRIANAGQEIGNWISHA